LRLSIAIARNSRSATRADEIRELEVDRTPHEIARFVRITPPNIAVRNAGTVHVHLRRDPLQALTDSRALPRSAARRAASRSELRMSAILAPGSPPGIDATGDASDAAALFACHARQRRRHRAGDETSRHETERGCRDSELERSRQVRRFRGLRPLRRRPVPSQQWNAADEKSERRLHPEGFRQSDSHAVLRDDHQRYHRAHPAT
jgi:hypothetical protein